jgi:hypothetical protein
VHPHIGSVELIEPAIDLAYTLERISALEGYVRESEQIQIAFDQIQQMLSSRPIHSIALFQGGKDDRVNQEFNRQLRQRVAGMEFLYPGKSLFHRDNLEMVFREVSKLILKPY